MKTNQLTALSVMYALAAMKSTRYSDKLIHGSQKHKGNGAFGKSGMKRKKR